MEPFLKMLLDEIDADGVCGGLISMMEGGEDRSVVSMVS